MSNKYLQPKWTMEKLVAENARLMNNPANRNATPESIYKYNKKTMKKLDDISWAVYHLLKAQKAHA